MTNQVDTQEPIKDENAAHSIASVWRPTLRQIVDAFVDGDYTLARGLPSVAPIPPAVAKQIAKYLEDYGETLLELPDETWQSSIAQWMGDHWEILVDLWTVESGQSDLVLSGRVFETDGGFQIVVDSVHVP